MATLTTSFPIAIENLSSAFSEATHCIPENFPLESYPPKDGEQDLKNVLRANDTFTKKYIVIDSSNNFSVSSDKVNACPMPIFAEKIYEWSKQLDMEVLLPKEKILLTSIRENLAPILYNYQIKHPEPSEIVSKIAASLEKLHECDNTTRKVHFAAMDAILERDNSKVDLKAKHPTRDDYRSVGGRTPLGLFANPSKETPYALNLAYFVPRSIPESINCSKNEATKDEWLDTDHIFTTSIDENLMPKKGALKAFLSQAIGPDLP